MGIHQDRNRQLPRLFLIGFMCDDLLLALVHHLDDNFVFGNESSRDLDRRVKQASRVTAQINAAALSCLASGVIRSLSLNSSAVFSANRVIDDLPDFVLVQL